MNINKGQFDLEGDSIKVRDLSGDAYAVIKLELVPNVQVTVTHLTEREDATTDALLDRGVSTLRKFALRRHQAKPNLSAAELLAEYQEQLLLSAPNPRRREERPRRK